KSAPTTLGTPDTRYDPNQVENTLIAVPKPIESLSIGDFVVTTRGEKPVQWIGRQHFTQGRSARWPDSVHPICVSRSAVNGISITRAVPKGMRAIGYFHIELETHEVILAEGGLVETLLLTSGRESFSNFVEYERLYGLNRTDFLGGCFI